MNEWLRRALFLPDQASSYSMAVDHLHYFVILTTFFASTAVGLTAIYFFIRYRRRSETQTTPHMQPSGKVEAAFIFIPLSLFLLWPAGPTLGLVLAVLGTGVWFGVQHLGYLEFGELRRVAHRTMEQRQIFINNLAIRRAVEALKVSSNYDELCGTLEAAFTSNDFDAFELRLHRLPGELHETHGLQLLSTGEAYFRWKRPGSHFAHEKVTAWSLTLDLMTTANRRAGNMTIYRLYTKRDLQLDVNLLTSAFPIALADALDRALAQVVEVPPANIEDTGVMAAQAG